MSCLSPRLRWHFSPRLSPLGFVRCESLPESGWVRAAVVNKYDLIDSWPLTLTSKMWPNWRTPIRLNYVCVRIIASVFVFSFLSECVCVWLLLHMQLGRLVATDIDNGIGDTQLLVLLITPGWAVTFLRAHCFGPSQIPCLCRPPGSGRLTSLTLCPLMSAPSLAAEAHRPCLAPRTQPWMTETLITQEAQVVWGGWGLCVCVCFDTTPIETGEPN